MLFPANRRPVNRTGVYLLKPLLLALILQMPINAVLTTPAQAESISTQNYHIPAGKLSTALTRFANTSGVLLSVDGDILKNKTTSGLKGDFSTSQALQKLLRGSGLTAKFGKDNSVRIVAVPKHDQHGSTQTAPVLVTSASGYEQVETNASASISIITQEELKGKSYRDVTDVLKNVPGISIEGGGGGKIESTEVTIRGMGEDYVLFLVDGRPLGASGEAYYNGYGRATQIGWLPPLSSIERIEVIRGPMSSLYGSSALGGVINVITKKGANTWNGNISVDTVIPANSKSGSAKQARYYLNGPLIKDTLSLTLYGSRYHRDEDDIVDGFAEKDRIDNTAKFTWTPTDNQTVEIEAGLSGHDNKRTADKSGDGSENSMNNERQNYALVHDIDWETEIPTSTLTYLTYEDVDIENGDNLSKYMATIANTKTIMSFDSNYLTVGLDYKLEQTNHDQDRFYGPNGDLNLSRWQAAVFLEDEYFLTDKFTVTGGVRFDENEDFGSFVTPRLYGVYNLTEQFTIKGGVGGGFKAPTLKQSDENIVENAARSRAFDQGNSNLKPETSVNYELGFIWNGSNGINFGLTAYHTDFKDQIGKKIICDSRPAYNCTVNGESRQYINQYINNDAAELNGVEASFEMPIGKTVNFATNYTYSQSEITKSEQAPEKVGEPFNNLPKHMANLSINWDPTSLWNLWTSVNYKSETIDDEQRIPSYTIVDAGVNYQALKYINIFGGVYNLFDKQINTETYGKTLDGRRFNLGVSVDF